VHLSGRLHLGLTPWLEMQGDGAEALCRQGERAEALGFDSLFLPEHHFAGPGSLPAPLLLLAALAARTRRLRLGTTSYLLPLRHPLHVAAEVAVLDRLSGGRLIFGVGRGFRPSLFAAFAVPAAEKRERFEAHLEAIRRAWRGEELAAAGTAGEAGPVALAPRPLQRPHPPIWVAAFGPRAVEQAGRLGLPYLASPLEPLAALERNYARHREAAQAAGRALPREVPVIRSVFASRKPSRLQEAREALERAAAQLARSAAPSLRRAAAAPLGERALVGEPEALADGLARYRERLGVTHLIARLHVPGARPAALEESLELVADLAA
jgi:alkanesulfonate monooxygenase SsuD/methylene tetrahydromethanopterin reductase-like flavin-dependent oxidoreductase (luciferase family)